MAAFDDLTEQRKRFVEEYVADLNATQAAIRAGYSPKSAHVQGPKLLAKPGVAQAVKDALEARSKRTRINADWLLMRLADEVEADLADLYDDNGDLKPTNEWPKIWRQGLVSGIDLEVAQQLGDEAPEVRIKKVRISDRLKRLELIGKHIDVSAFEERVRHSGEMVNVVISGDDADL